MGGGGGGVVARYSQNEIPDFSLTSLCFLKIEEPDPIIWKDQEDTGFETSKKSRMKPRVLGYSDYQLPLSLLL